MPELKLNQTVLDTAIRKADYSVHRKMFCGKFTPSELMQLWFAGARFSRADLEDFTKAYKAGDSKQIYHWFTAKRPLADQIMRNLSGPHTNT